VVDDDPVNRALSYPYLVPAGSFSFDTSRDRISHPDDAELLSRHDGRHLVLAIGSNASPEQLARKFREFAGDPHIPALAVELRDHDVVFAARVSSYGAVPATLAPCPGVAAAVKLTMLTPEQLDRMNETEALGSGYDIERLAVSTVALHGRPLDAWLPSASVVLSHVAVAGPLHVDGQPVALDAVHAQHRRWPSMTEQEVLQRLASGLDLDVGTFVRKAIGDESFRLSLNARLKAGEGPV
jgi:hypothetical protein